MEIFDEAEINNYDNLKYYGRVGRFEIAGKQVGLCHEPYLIDKVLKLGKCHIIFYGHTHKAWIDDKEQVIKVNPGTLGGMLARASFATWHTATNEIKLRVLDEL
jgi:predicted phosphodiesterase